MWDAAPGTFEAKVQVLVQFRQREISQVVDKAAVTRLCLQRSGVSIGLEVGHFIGR
jgi:hypothetical protein